MSNKKRTLFVRIMCLILAFLMVGSLFLSLFYY